MTRLIYAPRRPDALSEDAARTMFGQAAITDRDDDLYQLLDQINEDRAQMQRSLLALVPATKGRNRIVVPNPLMQPTYARMRAEIRAVK
jgi:hypothetical protein